MLEGQVAVLSAGAIEAPEAVDVLEALFDSDIYRPDQQSFMLYPDRELPSFLEKNRVPADALKMFPFLERMLAEGDERIVTRDAEGTLRFNAEFINVGALKARLDSLAPQFGDELEAARETLLELYETVFDHNSFTGRSGGMFGFEGLGCIYWHMVSKLLLAVQENFFAALDNHVDRNTCNQLGQLYYRIREGIGFNKTPGEFGAFPTDPYSHTPGNGGARQPGMTGQVKEEILSRFGELGVRVNDGVARFEPALLREREFVTKSRQLRFLDVDGEWQELDVPPGTIGFTWCQVPIIYERIEQGEPSLTITRDTNERLSFDQLVLPAEESTELFLRSGRIRQVWVRLRANTLFAE
jgi:hypothetical protein